jgi:hypothetical protein
VPTGEAAAEDGVADPGQGPGGVPPLGSVHLTEASDHQTQLEESLEVHGESDRMRDFAVGVLRNCNCHGFARENTFDLVV